MYSGRSSGLAEATVATGLHGPVTVILSSPAANTTQITGKLYRKDGTTTSHQLMTFAVDAGPATELRPGPLAAGESLYLTLDAAPTAQLIITSW